MNSLELATRIAQLADDKKAEDIIVLEVSELVFVTDYFVICSGRNDRHVKSVADNIIGELRDAGQKPYWVDGEKLGLWVVLDYGSVVVHVFREEERGVYQLERLWKDAGQIDWESTVSSDVARE